MLPAKQGESPLWVITGRFPGDRDASVPPLGADMPGAGPIFGYGSTSALLARLLTSGCPPAADIAGADRKVRDGPKADLSAARQNVSYGPGTD